MVVFASYLSPALLLTIRTINHFSQAAETTDQVRVLLGVSKEVDRKKDSKIEKIQ